MPKRNNIFTGALLATTLLLQGCVTTNPATGGSDFTPFMSPAKETALGKQQHPQVIKQHGGVLDVPKIAGYVAVTGGRLAAVSELPNSPFTFTVLNSPIVNAFALPGGYIYVTRGILALFNSESEMASVLGHEIGHVTARHSAKRYNKSLFTGLGVALLGAALKNKGLSDALGYGSQLYLKSYSRGNEYESDQLGVRYSTKAGFDPYAAADMLTSLDAQSNLQDIISNRTGQQRPPEFFSTHPNTRDRVSRAFAAAQKTGLAQNSRDRGQNRYLNAIDGMIYGDDPAQGVIKGRTFTHGPLRFTFTVPEEFQLINTSEAVYARGTKRADGAVVIFASNPTKGRNLIEVTAAIWKSFVKEVTLQNLKEVTVGGLPAITGWADTTVNKVKSRVQIATIRTSDTKSYYFLTVTPYHMVFNYAHQLNIMVHSFKRLSPTQAKKVKGKIIRIATVQKGDTTQSLSRHMAFADHRLERFLVLNGLQNQDGLVAGQRVKLVVYDK